MVHECILTPNYIYMSMVATGRACAVYFSSSQQSLMGSLLYW